LCVIFHVIDDLILIQDAKCYSCAEKAADAKRNTERAHIIAKEQEEKKKQQEEADLLAKVEEEKKKKEAEEAKAKAEAKAKEAEKKKQKKAAAKAAAPAKAAVTPAAAPAASAAPAAAKPAAAPKADAAKVPTVKCSDCSVGLVAGSNASKRQCSHGFSHPRCNSCSAKAVAAEQENAQVEKKQRKEAALKEPHAFVVGLQNQQNPQNDSEKKKKQRRGGQAHKPNTEAAKLEEKKVSLNELIF